jgi:M6 family metalloprotease-like protein
MHRRLLLAIAIAIALCPVSTSAQDVEMLGRRYGTRPPDAYYQEMARNPNAFRFSRGRPARMREARAFRGFRPAGVGAGGPALGLGPRDGPVTGTVSVPVLLGLFNDSPASPPVLRIDVQDGYFGPGPATVASYYSEVSNGNITLVGDVQDWVRSSMDSTDVAEGISGLGCCGIGDYITTLVDSLEAAGFDWSAYDNDGPDGVPNSLDDDGFVDALAVIHPTAGAECPGSHLNRIWSHKWTLGSASSTGSYQTATPSTSGAFIRIDDYFVQGALTCSGGALNEIGVFAHELGHAFGLPDLYDTRSFGVPHDGAGSWELMASGTWGCSGSAPYSPCHMGAWSKAMLGWVTVDTLPPDTDLGTLTLPPVETSGIVYRVDAGDGSDEYFLLENRQSLPTTTYDQALPSEGLLIWQIDAGVVDVGWPDNTVNASDHMGVWLRQADGLDELGVPGGDRGDSGDPFPGFTGNTEFHAETNPAARSFEGTATGVSVLDITASADDMTFHLLTQFAALSDFSVDLIATVPQSLQLTVPGGTPPVSWTVVGGNPPVGVTVQLDGRVTGAAVELGLFPVVVEATDGLGLTATATVTLNVSAPSFSIELLAADFLLGEQPLDSIQAVFVDRQGNDNGTYDLGDFRAWLLANPTLPLSADLTSTAEKRIVTVPMRLAKPEEPR